MTDGSLQKASASQLITPQAVAERTYAVERRMAGLRLWVFAAVSGLLFLLLRDSEISRWHVVVLLGLAWAYALFGYFAEPYRRIAFFRTGYATSGLDAVLAFVFVYATGGYRSQFFVALYMVVIEVAFRYPTRDALVSVVLYSGGYLGMLGALGQLSGHVADVAVRVAFIPVAAAVGAIMSRELHAQTEAKIEAMLRMREEEERAQAVVARTEAERQQVEGKLSRAEEQIRQAQKMDAIGRLAGGVAHDFNNVLSVILSYASFVRDGLKPDDPLRGDVKEIQVAAERAAKLTHQLLAFSRRQVLQPRILDPNDVIRGMESMLRRLVGEDVELLFRPGAAVGRIKSDPSQIEQVLMNLVINARDAMPTGGKLTIETNNVELERSAQQPAGSYVLLAVTDSGIGMDRETQSRIFEPFFTTKEIGKGTGLGLATVFGIVQQSGGAIRVYSEPGHGTTFKIYLPRHEEAQADAVRSLPGRPPPGGRETILLVEDEGQLRAIAATVLSRAGYRVMEARNGVDALEKAKEFPGAIHLLLTDVIMPEMGGRPLMERMTELRPETKVLYMSGYTDDVVVLHGLLQGDVEFLQKPIRPETLLRRVRDVLDGGRQVMPSVA
jgi:signal transduction histidine kinase/CheY-like chemotaxis protein